MRTHSSIAPRVAAARPDIAAWIVLAALAVVALLTFDQYGLAWDDYSHGHYGELLLAYYTSGFTDMRAFTFYNLYYYGGGFDLVAAILDKITPFELFATRRLTGVLVGLAGLFVVWRTARRLGGPVAGLAALVLLAATPLYYGHMFINAKDTPFAVAMAFLAYATVRNFEEYPRPRIPTILLFGLALGLAIGTRVIGGIGLVFAAAGVAVLFAIDRRELGAKAAAWRVGSFAVSLGLALPLAYVVMGIIWPWSVLAPLNPLRAVEFYSHFWEKPWKDLYEGARILITDMPRTYVPLLCLLKLPEIFVALGLAGTAGGSVVVLRGGAEPWRRASLALLIAAAMLPILIAVVTRPALYNGIRHFLFVIPPFAVLGGLAAAYLLDRLRAYARPAAAAGIVAFVGLLSVTVVDFWRIHPYQYALFNHLAGGVRGAQSQYMLDYWGLGMKEASENLLARLDEMNVEPPRNRKWKVAVCGPAHTVGFELGPAFEATGDPKGADFAISLGTYYCAKLSAPILATAEREGVVFARAYDLRGRNIASTYIAPDDEKKSSDTPSNIDGVF
ncbi:MAG TPA: glycosyltransferase family 39 protein [Xanthobacteraceae bacterium]|jgi:4-amino-4-deoxy-L-arabinose transferase-like glycosyltransferase